MSCRGWPHVSFYPAGGGGDFGGNYFGTGASVLKRWWGSEPTVRKAIITPDARATSEFPHAVRFEQGATRFLDGDKITITEVRGTADRFTPGQTYRIKGTYTLSSHDRAMLAAYVTAMDPENGKEHLAQIADDRRRPGQRRIHADPADVVPGLAACQLLPGRRRERFRRQIFRDGRLGPEAMVGVERDGLKACSGGCGLKTWTHLDCTVRLVRVHGPRVTLVQQ
jgi:hypothetical protein